MLHYPSIFSSDTSVFGKRIKGPKFASDVFDTDVGATVLGYAHQHITEVKRAREALKIEC